jgi:NTP pyrophosphatase (non-canonical NTP hydrolase)
LRKLQRYQKQADSHWGFDFSLWEEIVGPQLGLPGITEDIRDPKVDATIRRLEYITLALGGEVGELANSIKKLRRALLQGKKLGDLSPDDIQQEVGDILAYLLKLCNLMNWDLEQLYLDKMKQNEERFGEVLKKP